MRYRRSGVGLGGAVSELRARSSGLPVPLRTVAREWTRIGLTGFGGPPAHIALLRQLVVDRAGVDGRRASSRTPTRPAACCPARPRRSWRSSAPTASPGRPGAIVGGLGFIVPAVVLILALSLLFLAHAPPLWVRGAGAGAGAAVAAVAVQAARALIGPSFAARPRRPRPAAALGGPTSRSATAAAALIGPYLVLALLACGAVRARGPPRRPGARLAGVLLGPGAARSRSGGLGALAWTAFKVGALSFGGGFVIIPLMQSDAVHAYHWMTNAQFLNAVALGQVTPGPVVATVAAVGYAAHGIAGGVLAALVAFTPSFSFVLLGGGRFERLRANAARARVPRRRRPGRDRRDPRRRDHARPRAAGGLAVRRARRGPRRLDRRSAASSKRCSPPA